MFELEIMPNVVNRAKLAGMCGDNSCVIEREAADAAVLVVVRICGRPEPCFSTPLIYTVLRGRIGSGPGRNCVSRLHRIDLGTAPIGEQKTIVE